MNSIWQLQGKNPTDGYLIVILHGRGDSPMGWESFLSELAIENLSAYLVSAPDPYPGGGYSWYDHPPNQLPGVLRSRNYLESIFKDLSAKGFVPDRTFLFGFSQGCLMTLEFGSRYSERLAGYIGVSGYCLNPDAILVDLTPKIINANWFITHGTADDVLPIQRTREQIQRLIEGGMNIDYREYNKAHTIDESHEIPEIREWLLQRMK